MKKKIVEYDVLRVLLTLIVVIGHCAYVVIESSCGGINYADMVQGSRIQFLINANNYVIYTFHMPCFIALSGAVYSMQIQQGKSQKFGEFCLNKAKRLIIPFFAVGLLYSIPLKYLTGYWSDSEHPLKDIFTGQILLQGNSHLWYLACLYLIFLIFWIYSRLERYRGGGAVMSAGIILLYVFHVSTPLHLVNNVLNYLLWFWMGYQFEKQREQLNLRISRRICLVLVTVFMLLAGVDVVFWKEFSDSSILRTCVHNLHRIVAAAAGSAAVYAVSYLLSRGRLPENSLFQRCSRASLGVYLYSDPLNYVILFLVHLLLNGSNPELVAALLFVLRVSLTFLISFLFTEFLQKRKIRYLA